jgi:hypothetical protein
LRVGLVFAGEKCGLEEEEEDPNEFKETTNAS